MSKLTLPILCAYLPHRTKVTFRDCVHELKVIDGDLNMLKLHGRYHSDWCSYSDIKLILRPLSSLTKPITHNGEEVIPFHVINDMLPKGAVFPTNTTHNWTGLIFFRKHTDFPEINIEWELIEKIRDFLLSLHMDIFGLLESGDALPIEELTANQP